MAYKNRGPGKRRSNYYRVCSNKDSPILSGLINILTLVLILILFFNCINLLNGFNHLEDINRQAEAHTSREITQVIQTSSPQKEASKEKTPTDAEAKVVSSMIPSILPAKGTVSSGYGGRKLSISRGKSDFHYGIDIANTSGTEVHASADGVVEFSGWQNGYGNVVIIKHNETYTTVYGHNSKLLVRKGDAVKKGEVISLMGSTGRSTGPHVHFEIRVNNKAVNPYTIIK